MKLDLKQITAIIVIRLKPLGRYKILFFGLLVIALYGYVVLQINKASNVQPTADQTQTAAKATPKIDPVIVKQLQQLQDNSVSVKALFNSDRTNPFQ